MGDPAGIGGEITMGAWERLRATGPAFVAFDDPARFDGRVPVCVVGRSAEAAACFRDALPVLPIPLAAQATPGKPDPANGAATVASIEQAVRSAMAAETSGVVTNPINKAALYATGFAHPGHTEFLGALTGSETAPVMMLACPQLRVVPVTIHVALRRALDMLNADAIVMASRVTAAALSRDFGIARPRLAIAGLNPHAGEQGAMGREEIEYIIPAIGRLQEAGIDVSGPWPPDTMFTPAARTRYDAAICMYHDQALIPLKTLDVTQGVNVTLGLPIVRTSPDHGTAYDIAGTGRADPSSLVAAIRMAADMAARRREFAA